MRMMNAISVLDHITPFCEKYPQTAACLSQVYLDLTKAKTWKEVEVVEIEPLQSITLFFSSLQSFLNKPLYKSVTLAITFPDSTVVYYKVHEGIVPPTNNCVG
ncbi:hypothetical protein C1645_733799 [Glomus cerebriforme]|uniref:tRNA-splicing endonuclease subunit Sen15 domain-containing protein n=1 Tax=Glomus cerebriforme TaxID=658196 RepID=A0A397TC04_9GLOM|nr:hypothetical protein C1645_733799 [Glomus cerebriforme]